MNSYGQMKEARNRGPLFLVDVIYSYEEAPAKSGTAADVMA
jgi:hypothetical protein